MSWHSMYSESPCRDVCMPGRCHCMRPRLSSKTNGCVPVDKIKDNATRCSRYTHTLDLSARSDTPPTSLVRLGCCVQILCGARELQTHPPMDPPLVGARSLSSNISAPIPSTWLCAALAPEGPTDLVRYTRQHCITYATDIRVTETRFFSASRSSTIFSWNAAIPLLL